ncbi:hypothetical protein cypCar_00016112 [Cyprinus carpio]|nr:hypothetical protein cypCar_00016112 [Cyprinus carpio]
MSSAHSDIHLRAVI